MNTVIVKWTSWDDESKMLDALRWWKVELMHEKIDNMQQRIKAWLITLIDEGKNWNTSSSTEFIKISDSAWSVYKYSTKVLFTLLNLNCK